VTLRQLSQQRGAQPGGADPGCAGRVRPAAEEAGHSRRWASSTAAKLAYPGAPKKILREASERGKWRNRGRVALIVLYLPAHTERRGRARNSGKGAAAHVR